MIRISKIIEGKATLSGCVACTNREQQLYTLFFGISEDSSFRVVACEKCLGELSQKIGNTIEGEDLWRSKLNPMY